MTDGDALLKKRFSELSARSSARGIWTYSEFLTMAEQDALMSVPEAKPYALDGGYDGAERRVACFGSEDICGYAAERPACLLAEPVSKKFAEALSHRDFLGALMSLGVRREVLGDIVPAENGAYIFCLAQVADYIAESLTEVRRTPVRCAVSELPEALAAGEPEERETVVQSERADALTAAVYKLSRAEAQELFERGRVFVNSRLTESPSRPLSPGDIVSVRGLGRFVYGGAPRETKKGRLRVTVRVY